MIAPSVVETLAPSIRTVRRNWPPLLVVQVAAVALVTLYYQSEALREWATGVGQLKAAGGLPLAFLAGAIAGGILPEIAKLIAGRRTRLLGPQMRRATWAGFVYGLTGVLVYLLYQGLARLFGTGVDLVTIIQKVAVDLLLFTPLITIPLGVAMFAWFQVDFAGGFWRQAVTVRFYRTRVLPVLPLCWAFWFPVVFCVYALPLDLQFPFTILMQSAWSVLLVSFVLDEHKT